MNDFKNILLAWASASTSMHAAVEAQTLITIVSAIILPIVFFTLGKTVDVLLQIRLRRTEAQNQGKENNSDK